MNDFEEDITTATPEGSEAETETANPNPGSESDGVSESGDDELSRLAVCKVLGFEKIADYKKYGDQVDRLVEYAHSSGAKTIPEIISKISELRSDVGRSKNIHELSVYAGLALEKARLDKEMESFHAKP